MVGGLLAQAGGGADIAGLGLDVASLIESVVYVAAGMVLFAIAFVIMTKVAPFSVRKEIEDDQNVALAVLMGSVILGIAIIVAAAVQGG